MIRCAPSAPSAAAGLAALAVLLSARPSPAQAPDYLGLAAELQSLGEYEACAVEALRQAYVRPQDTEVARERASLCLMKARRFDDARRMLLRIGGEGGAAALSPSLRFRLCLSEVFAGAQTLSEPCSDGPAGHPERSRGTPAGERWSRLAAYTPVMHALMLEQWDRATPLLQAFSAPGGDATLAGWAAQDRGFVLRHAALPRRSAFLAGFLSALVPGLGRVYLGRWQDGLLSFVLIGVPVGFAVDGFLRDGASSVRGWLLATSTAVLYAGNVYGSALGAGVLYEERLEALRGDVRRAYDARVEP